ncbi:hypothetical protein [Streptomyces sp. AC495_CC817]|uniref:hypothetical protein n=1 Tax=Streptomyces sp. AC495_CC817 TaxID=2823900 RepID=UPI001C26088D|nr:hypothetical protein [Streptomyces sp. AC495_CC817]
MRRFAAVSVLAVGVLAGTTACMPPFLDVCPAIGYVSAVSIDTGAFGEAILVQVCDGEECTLGPGDDPADSTTSFGAYPADDGWAVTFSAAVPDTVTVRVYDLVGAEIAQGDYDIDWTHSTERCGGPSTAPPIVLVP